MKNLKKNSRQTDPLGKDLSDLLLTDNWKAVRFELQPKNKTITIRVSENLLDAVKERAKKSGLDYQKFVRLALERFVLEYRP